MDCTDEYLSRVPSRCYRCHAQTQQYQVCKKCRKVTKLSHVWVVSNYDGVSKNAIHYLKFERGLNIAIPVAQEMADILPRLSSDTVVIYVPTAPSRVRLRGYDQSKILAKRIAKIKKLDFANMVVRLTNSRQVGSSKQKRIDQARVSFAVKKQTKIPEKVLLVDDVTTSGATIESLAELLKNAGVNTVDVVVFAQVSE